MMNAQERYPITSEMLEPCFSSIVGRLGMRAYHAKEQGDTVDLLRACQYLWRAVHLLSYITCVVETAVHATLAANNEIVRTSQAITEMLLPHEVCPLTDWDDYGQPKTRKKEELKP